MLRRAMMAGGGAPAPGNKYQFEIVIVSGVPNVKMAGLADKTNSASVIAGNLANSAAIESVGYLDSGLLYRNLSTGVSSGSATASSNGDIVTIALDLSVPSVQLFLNGSSIGTVPLPSGKTWYPVASLRNTSSCRLVPSSLTYPQPGFTDWGGAFDSGAKDIQITLSSGDLVATKSGTQWRSAYGTVGRS